MALSHVECPKGGVSQLTLLEKSRVGISAYGLSTHGEGEDVEADEGMLDGTEVT